MNESTQKCLMKLTTKIYLCIIKNKEIDRSLFGVLLKLFSMISDCCQLMVMKVIIRLKECWFKLIMRFEIGIIDGKYRI